MVAGEDLLQAVGSLFLICANVEVTLAINLARLMDHPREAEGKTILLVSPMDAKVKLEQIKIASVLLQLPNAAEIARNCDKIRKLFQRRNDIAHNSNLQTAPGRLIVRPLRLEKGQLSRDKVFTTEQILQYGDLLVARTRCLGGQLNDAGLVPLVTHSE